MLQLIENGDWLEDIHVETVSDMLKEQFPNLAGLYNPCRGQNLSFPESPDPFLQILHVQNNHWITVTSIPPSCVYIYDSKYNLMTDNTKMQIAAIMHTDESCIDVKIPRIQYQEGSSDCGLYSIAYATDVAYVTGSGKTLRPVQKSIIRYEHV